MITTRSYIEIKPDLLAQTLVRATVAKMDRVLQTQKQRNFSFSEPPGSRTGTLSESTGHTPGNINRPSKFNDLGHPVIVPVYQNTPVKEL